MHSPQNADAEQIEDTEALEPGMVVETPRGDDKRGALRSTGAKEQSHGHTETATGDDDDSFLGQVEEQVPTAEGQRRNEVETAQRRGDERADVASDAGAGEAQWQIQPGARFSLRQLGPGLIAGMSGNDASAVTAYAIAGAIAG